jgi:hypothetical protein
MADHILFDRLAYLDRLKRAGIPDDHARAHAEAMDAALRASTATKCDLESLKYDLTVRMGGLSFAIVAVLAGIKYFG